MSKQTGIPKGAAVAINDLRDNCAKIKPGQEVLLLAHMDGLYGGDNLVDQEAISWIQTTIQLCGANASVLWIDEPAKLHSWRIPPIFKGALSACDVCINHSFNIVTEEMIELREIIAENNVRLVRNFATTAALLCTPWAQTPYELVSEIRYQASLNFKEGLPWQLTDDNGTYLEGIINAPDLDRPGFSSYSLRREEAAHYLPWPEWLHPPINLFNTSGIVVFDRMLSWWSRYIGISPFFSKPIRLTIDNCRITEISGGDEADALRRFLSSMRERSGDAVYDFNQLHSGVHPQAAVGPHQCASPLYRRLIEHMHTSNIHFHIGSFTDYDGKYWMHCTADTRTATFRVGDTLVHDHGYLTALDSPAVIAVAQKYPDRPGLAPETTSF